MHPRAPQDRRQTLPPLSGCVFCSQVKILNSLCRSMMQMLASAGFFPLVGSNVRGRLAKIVLWHAAPQSCDGVA